MNNPIPEYPTLAEIIASHHLHDEPDLAAKRIMDHFAKRFPDATHAVLFVNEDLSSSHIGEWSVMVVGPSVSFHTLADVEGKHLNDLPSVRQYPVGYVTLKRGDS